MDSVWRPETPLEIKIHFQSGPFFASSHFFMDKIFFKKTRWGKEPQYLKGIISEHIGPNGYHIEKPGHEMWLKHISCKVASFSIIISKVKNVGARALWHGYSKYSLFTWFFLEGWILTWDFARGL